MNQQKPEIVEELNPQKAKLTFENAISPAQNLLTSKESNALALRYGLMGKEKHEICDIAIRFKASIPAIQKLIKDALDKSLNKPIQQILRQAANRAARYHRHKGKDGNADLEMVCKLLIKADELNDCRIVFDTSNKR
jgi:hypothetical protein